MRRVLMDTRSALLAEAAKKLLDMWGVSNVRINALPGLYFCEEIRKVDVDENQVSDESESTARRTSRVELVRFLDISKIIKSYTNQGKLILI